MSAQPPRYSELSSYDPARYVVSHGRVFQVSPSISSQQPHPQQMSVPQTMGPPQAYAPQTYMAQPYMPQACIPCVPVYAPMHHTQALIPIPYPYAAVNTAQPNIPAAPVYAQAQAQPQPQLLQQSPPLLSRPPPTYYQPSLPAPLPQQTPDIPPPPPPGYVMIPGTSYAVPKEWIREENNKELKKFVNKMLKGISDKKKRKELKKAIRASLIILRDICA